MSWFSNLFQSKSSRLMEALHKLIDHTATQQQTIQQQAAVIAAPAVQAVINTGGGVVAAGGSSGSDLKPQPPRPWQPPINPSTAPGSFPAPADLVPVAKKQWTSFSDMYEAQSAYAWTLLTPEQQQAAIASHQNSLNATANLFKVGIDIPVMDKATQDALLTAFDMNVAARPDLAWWDLAQSPTSIQQQFALLNRGMPATEMNYNINRYASGAAPAERMGQIRTD